MEVQHMGTNLEQASHIWGTRFSREWLDNAPIYCENARISGT
jgi:hypothetical protein